MYKIPRHLLLMLVLASSVGCEVAYQKPYHSVSPFAPDTWVKPLEPSKYAYFKTHHSSEFRIRRTGAGEHWSEVFKSEGSTERYPRFYQLEPGSYEIEYTQFYWHEYSQEGEVVTYQEFTAREDGIIEMFNGTNAKETISVVFAPGVYTLGHFGGPDKRWLKKRFNGGVRSIHLTQHLYRFVSGGYNNAFLMDSSDTKKYKKTYRSSNEVRSEKWDLCDPCFAVPE